MHSARREGEAEPGRQGAGLEHPSGVFCPGPQHSTHLFDVGEEGACREALSQARKQVLPDQEHGALRLEDALQRQHVRHFQAQIRRSGDTGKEGEGKRKSGRGFPDKRCAGPAAPRHAKSPSQPPPRCLGLHVALPCRFLGDTCRKST